MFETSVVREHAIPAERRAGLVTLSVALHSFIALGAIAVALTNLQFPKHAPNQLAQFISTPVIELPQPKGKPDGNGDGKPKAAAVSPVRPMPPQPVANLAPNNVPDAVPQLQPAASDSDATSLTARTDTGGTGERRGIPDGVDDAIDLGQPLVSKPAADEPPLVIAGDVRAPVVIQRVAPAYPESLRRARMSGVVHLLCVIDKQGQIRDAKVVSSSFAGFEQPALDAVQKWRFVAGSLHGKPVDTYFDLTITFSVR
jgi:TonB family protein